MRLQPALRWFESSRGVLGQGFIALALFLYLKIRIYNELQSSLHNGTELLLSALLLLLLSLLW